MNELFDRYVGAYNSLALPRRASSVSPFASSTTGQSLFDSARNTGMQAKRLWEDMMGRYANDLNALNAKSWQWRSARSAGGLQGLGFLDDALRRYNAFNTGVWSGMLGGVTGNALADSLARH